MRHTLTVLAVLALLPGGCSSMPLAHKGPPPVAVVSAKSVGLPMKPGLKIAVDVVMARLRSAEAGQLQSIEGAEPQIYALAAALMPPAKAAGTRASAVEPAANDSARLTPTAYSAGPFAQAPALRHGRSLFFAVHLGSYRSAERAFEGFAQLRNEAPQLSALQARTERVDLGPGKGIYQRLKAGPLRSRGAADALCDILHQSGLYCAVADFTGQGANA